MPMKTTLPLAALLAWSSPATAFVQPKAVFGHWTIPPIVADTLYRSILIENRYGMNPDFDPADLPRYRSRGYEIDSVARVMRLRIRTRQWFGLDAEHRLSTVQTHIEYGADSVSDARDDMRYDEVGRLSWKITWGTGGSQTPDTTFYKWNHPSCADSRRTTLDGFEERVAWTVDGQGRCLVGTQETAYGGTWYKNFDLHQVWSPNGPVQESEITTGGDTLEIRRITYDGAGLPIADSTWLMDSTGRVLDQGCVATLVGGALSTRVCTSTYRSYYSQISTWSTSAPTSVRDRTLSPRFPLALRTTEGRAEFHNTGDRLVTLHLSTADGVRWGELPLPPGTSRSVPLHGRLLFWRAVSSGSERSGVLPAVP
jgi:hypothetical protein